MSGIDISELFNGYAELGGKLVEQQKRIQSETNKTADALEEMKRSINDLLNSVNPFRGKLEETNKALQKANELHKLGEITNGQHAAAVRELDARQAAALKSEEALTKARKFGADAARLQSGEVRKLGKSVFDALGDLRKGADPLDVLIKQGPALWDVFSSAQASGIGFRGVLAGIAAELSPMLVPLAGVAAGAAALAAPFALGAAAINNSNKDILGGLNLTEEQLARVTHKTASMGDVFQSTLNVVGRHIMEGPIGGALKGLQGLFAGAMSYIVNNALDQVANFVGFFGAAYDTITKNWKHFPVAIGAILVDAGNMFIRHVESQINTFLKGYNALVPIVNKVTGWKLPIAPNVELPKLQMIGDAAAKALADGMDKGVKVRADGFKKLLLDSLGSFGAEVSNDVVSNIRKGALKQAGKAPKTSGVSVTQASYVDNRASSNAYFNGANEAAERVVSVSDRTIGLDEPSQAVKLPDVDKLASGVPELNERNMLLSKMINHFEELNKLAPKLGDSLEKAFGGPGKALTGVISAAASLGKKLAEISLEENDPKNKDKGIEFARERVDATVSGFAEMSIAAQGFFNKNSSGYAALQSVEKAYRTWQFAQQVQAMAQEAVATARSVASSMTKGAASTAAGAAKMFEVLGPFAFPAVAAMVALLAGFGLSGGAGGSVPGANDMKTRQDAQGSGSVLGDSKAKSESLEKALTHAQAYENKDLEYGNAMVRSLKSIDDQIGAVASALAKSFGAGGMLSTEGLSLGKTGAAATLSNLGFSKSTTRTLQDQGIQFDAASLADIVAGGLSGSTYQQVLQTTKKKAFGITTSSKSKVITETGSLDADFLDQVGKLIGSLGKGVAEAAKALGATDVEGLLERFKVDLGKLSFKDMTGAQIEEALNAVFGKLGDDMAKAAVPAIAEFQKVGEGAFETLVRVARQYEVIDTTLKSVGMTFATVGVASLEARERLVDLVGGLDALTDQTAFFAEHFLSQSERLQPVKTSVASELGRLGLSPDLTRDGFKNLVLAQNVATEDGARLYAALMALAPAFDKVATAAETVREKQASIQDQIDDVTMTSAERLAKSRVREMEAVKALDASLAPLLETLWKAQDAAEAAKLATDRSNLYADLLDAQGRSEEAKALKRSLALAAIEDPVQRQYQQQIWAAVDAAAKVSAARDVLTQAYQREQDALQATKDKFTELSKSLRAFSVSLSATIAGSDLAGRYRATRQTFLTTASLARLGDPDAMGRLQAEGEAFTAASRDYASTSLDYLRDVGLVRSAVDEAADTADRQVSIAEQQLEALDASVQGLIQINASVVSVRDAIAGLQAANQAAAAAGVVSASGQPVNGPSAGPANTTLTQAQRDLNNASWWWGLTNSAAGKATADDPSDINRYAQGMAARYSPGYMDIVNTQGIEAANAMVAAGQLSFGQAGGLKFATGGGFEVGGSGPPDSKLFGLALSPGEAINVRRRGDGGDETLVNELRRLREELADLRATSARIATSNDKMERTLTNVTEGGRAMQTQAAA